MFEALGERLAAALKKITGRGVLRPEDVETGLISGLNAGEEVVSSGVFKLRNGASVQVNNSVQPPNNPKPTPEES